LVLLETGGSGGNADDFLAGVRPDAHIGILALVMAISVGVGCVAVEVTAIYSSRKLHHIYTSR